MSEQWSYYLQHSTKAYIGLDQVLALCLEDGLRILTLANRTVIDLGYLLWVVV